MLTISGAQLTHGLFLSVLILFPVPYSRGLAQGNMPLIIETMEKPTIQSLDLHKLDALFEGAAQQGYKKQEQYRKSQQSYKKSDFLIKKDTLLSRLKYDQDGQAFFAYDNDKKMVGFALVSLFKTWSLDMRFSGEPVKDFEFSKIKKSFYFGDNDNDPEDLEELVFPHIMELSILCSDGSSPGIGHALIERIKDVAKTKSYGSIILEAKAPAVGFYEKYGFHKISLVSDQKHKTKKKGSRNVHGAPYIHWTYPDEIMDLRVDKPSLMMFLSLGDQSRKRKRAN